VTWNERHDDILKILGLRKNVNVSELTKRLNVSEVTIRKDLSFLEDMGYLMRTRGGALLAEERDIKLSLKERSKENPETKKRIAFKAREFLHEGDTIYLDSGSTCRELARCLKDMNLRVVTNSIDVIFELADAPGIALYSIGGSYRKEAGSFIGPLSIDALGNFQFDTAFLGTSGFSREGAFSSQNIIESQVKKSAISMAERTVILTDASKYGRCAFSVFARSEDIDAVIIEREAEVLKEELEKMNIEIIFA
jgi:DeoR family transcriptional regulator of aga operon